MATDVDVEHGVAQHQHVQRRKRFEKWRSLAHPTVSRVGPTFAPAAAITRAATARSGATTSGRRSGFQRHSVSWPLSEEHTSELQSRVDLVCRLLLEKKKKNKNSRK